MRLKRLLCAAAIALTALAAGAFSFLSFAEQDFWSIGIYAGQNPYHLAPLEGVHNPVISAPDVRDVPALFVADPFMIREGGRWHMFFEVLNNDTDQGDIGYASSTDGLEWRYGQIVLDEPFHLSYPQIISHEGSFYMIPESREAGEVRLYRADPFPLRWRLTEVLLEGDYADPTVFQKDGRWWLYVLQGWDTLTLHGADGLFGLWTEHPASPLYRGDPSLYRPAGRPVDHLGGLVRFAQDGKEGYGTRVRAFHVDELTAERYREREVKAGPMLAGSGRGWNADGMHHVDAHEVEDRRWLACVDGKYVKRRFNMKAGRERALWQLGRLLPIRSESGD